MLSRVARYALELGREPYYGQQATAWSSLPVYSAPAPIMPDTDMRTGKRADAYGARVNYASGAIGGIVRGSTYLYGGDDPAAPPLWAEILEYAGYPIAPAASGGVMYRHAPANAPSASMRAWYEGVRQEVRGCRAQFTLSAGAGGYVKMDYLFRGLTPSWESNSSFPADIAVPALFKLQDAAFSITPSDAASITPVLLSFKLTSGRALKMRKRASADRTPGAVVFDGSFDPTWSSAVEIERDYDAAAAMRDGITYTLAMDIGGNATGARLSVSAKGARLRRAPAVGSSSGTHTYTLEFALGGSGAGLEYHYH